MPLDTRKLVIFANCSTPSSSFVIIKVSTKPESFLVSCHQTIIMYSKKVQVGKDQEKAQSEKDSHSKNRGGKKQTNNQVLIP